MCPKEAFLEGGRDPWSGGQASKAPVRERSPTERPGAGGCYGRERTGHCCGMRRTASPARKLGGWQEGLPRRWGRRLAELGGGMQRGLASESHSFPESS